MPIILLRPQADHPNLDGRLCYAPRPERGKREFGYEVVRLWERPAEELLSGDVAITIFRGVRMMEESDTYLMILEQGEERGIRESILGVGEERFGACGEDVRSQLSTINDLGRLKRMVRRAGSAANWQEILDTP